MALGDLPELEQRIESAYDEAKDQRLAMHRALETMRERENEAKGLHSEEWASAKNSEVRAVLLAGWLDADADYELARDDYGEAKIQFRLATLEIERLRLLVEAAKAGGSS